MRKSIIVMISLLVALCMFVGCNKENAAPAADAAAPAADVKTDLDFTTTDDAGSMDKTIVQNFVRQHVAGIRECYEKGLEQNKELKGKIVVEWTIGPEGTVTEVSLKESNMNDQSFESCVTENIKTWGFAPPKDGGTVKVEYPFEFSPAK